MSRILYNPYFLNVFNAYIFIAICKYTKVLFDNVVNNYFY
jgi:hypothetical protein